jgi:hypothetical protein
MNKLFLCNGICGDVVVIRAPDPQAAATLLQGWYPEAIVFHLPNFSLADFAKCLVHLPIDGPPEIIYAEMG